MKNKIRQINKQKRGAMEKNDVHQKSSSAAKLFLSSTMYKNSECIMLYMPLGNETDTKDIFNYALSDGKKIVYPVTDGASGVISPYVVTEKTEFEKGAFSVFVPKNAKKADAEKIDVVIVPGIAFDKKGARVGFGRGCYDRFLKDLSVIKIGYCYQYQVCQNIESDKFDVPMDYIVTEKEIIDCKNWFKSVN